MEQGYDLTAWLGRHESKETRPPLDEVIEALKAEGVDAFGATGYCFGGMFLFPSVKACSFRYNFPLVARYVFDLAFDNVIKVAVVSHPSLLEVPDDLEASRW